MKYHHVTVHDESLSKKTYICDFCDEEYERFQSLAQKSDGSFCSQDCQGRWIEENQSPEEAPRWNGGNVETECTTCKVTIYRSKYELENKNHLFCCDECETEWRRERFSGSTHSQYKSKEVACDHCGDITVKNPCNIDKGNHNFCSESCYGDWCSENLTGENHPNWRGGHQKYYGPTWYSQRRKAIDRDNDQCQDCGLTRDEHYDEYGSDLEVHHITPIRAFTDTEEANQLSNLITLCKSCHLQRENS